MFYTLDQLSKATGRTAQTLRLHIRQKWLRAVKIKGARGWRVAEADAKKWASKHPGVKL